MTVTKEGLKAEIQNLWDVGGEISDEYHQRFSAIRELEEQQCGCNQRYSAVLHRRWELEAELKALEKST